MITVPSQFPKHSPVKLAFIGEAPGEDEMDALLPLVGPSGKVFNALLRTANIDRSECYVGNVFSTKAENNDVTAWMKDPAVFEPEFVRLREELEAIKPQVVVPLGGTALWALAQTDAIGSYRGAIMPATRLLPGAKMVPTFHPAHVMRFWNMFSIVVKDLIRAAKEADRGPQIFYPPRKLLLSPTLEDLHAYTDRLLNSDLISTDIETAFKQITCIGFAPNAEEAICVPFVDFTQLDRCYWRTPDDELQAWLWVKMILESPVPKLGQNFAGYDFMWIWKKVGIEPRNVREDTRLLHHALYPELPKSLQFMGSAYTQQGPWKQWGHRSSKEKKDD